METDKDVESVESAESWLLLRLRHGQRQSAALIAEGEKAGHGAAALYACLWRTQTVIALHGGFWRRRGRNETVSRAGELRTVYDEVITL